MHSCVCVYVLHMCLRELCVCACVLQWSVTLAQCVALRSNTDVSLWKTNRTEALSPGRDYQNKRWPRPHLLLGPAVSWGACRGAFFCLTRTFTQVCSHMCSVLIFFHLVDFLGQLLCVHVCVSGPSISIGAMGGWWDSGGDDSPDCKRFRILRGRDRGRHGSRGEQTVPPPSSLLHDLWPFP